MSSSAVTAAMIIRGDQMTSFGENKNLRIFCFRSNAGQIRAALAVPEMRVKVYAVTVGKVTNLAELFNLKSESSNQDKQAIAA